MSITTVHVARPVPAVDTSIPRLALWVSQYALRRWVALLAVLATMLIKIGLDVLRPWPMKVLVDHALGAQPAPPWLVWAAGMLPGADTREGLVAWSVISTVVLFLLAWALGVATKYANIGFGQRMTFDVAAELFGHLQRLSLRFHSRKSVGDSIRRVTSDTGCVSILVKDAFLPVFASLFSLAAMFSIMWRMDARLTLLSVAVVPWLGLVLKRYMHPMLERSYEQQEWEGRQYDIIEQTLSAIPIVQAFGREEGHDQRFATVTARTIDASVASARVGAEFNVLISVATTLGTAGILWLGAQSVIEGTLTIGGILVFLSYLRSLYGPLELLAYSPWTAQGAAGSARRVLEILDTRRDVEDATDAHPLSHVRGHVRLENVTFAYDEGRPVLHAISLDVRPGETVAIVGATGAGKSTLVSLVPRFYDPLEGRVLIDGVDLRAVQLASLRSHVALVLQEPFLFPVTIAENIAYGRPDATSDQIIDAARAANAHGFIERLPAGYDTLVGERGATLSGGERQRISIARALLKNAPILILDEPTSALDAQTEGMLVEAVERLMRGRTTFIIAHRLSTVRKASRIIVLEHGRVIETGTHRELLELGGAYARFHRLQTGAA